MNAQSERCAEIAIGDFRYQIASDDEYLSALGTDGEPGPRIARFFERDEEVLGVPLRVVELTAEAGDVILIHPLVLHTRPTNAGTQPRFLLNKDLYLKSRSA